MKARILLPLFAALVFTGTARSETPGQPRPDAPPPRPDAPSPERLRHRLEELRRDGKNEEAERLERHAREFFEQHRANPPGERRAEPRREEFHRPNPPVSPGEREGHLAEAARHLHAAGIDVSPEMLERLAHRTHGHFAGRPPISPGSPGERTDRAPARPPFPPRSEAAPGAGSPLDAMHNEIRALARQVQELRNIVQREHAGARSEPRADRPHPPLPPGVERERREKPDLRPPGEDRPRGDAPFPPPR